MFKLTKINNSRMNVPEPEYLPPTASESFVEGEALVFSSGKLTKATGTTKPTHICLKKYTAPASNAETSLVIAYAPIWYSRLISTRRVSRLARYGSIFLGKKYYTGLVRLGAYVYAEVAAPAVADIASYYEKVPVVLGTKLTIATDGVGVVNNTTSGVATVVDEMSVNELRNGGNITVVIE